MHATHKKTFIIWQQRQLLALMTSFLLLTTIVISNVNAYLPFYEIDANSCYNATKSTTHATIQAAIDAADPNDIIQCDAGTYVENITVDKAVSLLGAGSDCTDGAANTIIQKASTTPLVTLTASGTAVNPILFQDMCIHPEGVFGFDIPDTGITVSHVTFDNIQVVGTNETNSSESERGLMVGETSSLTDFSVNDSAFDHLTYGWYFKKRVLASDLSTVERVTVTNTSFSHNDAKGIYAEKLSDVSFTGGAVHNNGLNLDFFNKQWHAGFDINLKAGTYQNLTFDGISFTQNALGTQHGVALMLKARDDGSYYGGAPATLANVLIQNNIISGNERGVRLGEVGKSNATPTNVSIVNNNFFNNAPTYMGVDGSDPGAIVLITTGTVLVKGNEFDGNPQVFSQLMGSLTAYANTIKNFTDAGLTSASGTANVRHNWWGTYDVQPTGVDDDSWDFRLGAPIVSWADGTGSASLLDTNGGTASLIGSGGTAVLINHNRPTDSGLAPFGKAISADIGTNQCSDFYDAFVIGGAANSSYDLSIPVDAACTNALIGDNLFQFDLIVGTGAPNADTCNPDTACWNLFSADRTGDVLTASVNIADLKGTPFVAPSVNNNAPTAVSLSTFSAATNNMWVVTAVILLLLTLTTFILWKRRDA